MARYWLPYGEQDLEVQIPDSISADLILPVEYPSPADPAAVVENSIKTPLDFEWSKFSRAQSVVIAINDKTRPVPHEIILPALLNHLKSIGITDDKITFWIATGTHLPLLPDEYTRILSREMVDRFNIRSHDINFEPGLVCLGRTSYGTETWVNRAFHEADLKIVVGNIEPHHFAGFSGGAKTAAIGLGGRLTINQNHAMLSHPDAWIGRYDNNPLRQDIEEMGRMIGVDLAVNVILNQDREIVASFSGEPGAVMRAGIPYAREICGVQAGSDYDLVIASAGGKPKDINFYQAQKALTHASLFARPGAPILLAAACPEGSGNASYEALMAELNSIEEIFKYFKTHPFKVGPHKALQVARILQRNPVVLVSSMAEALTKQLLLEPASSVQTAAEDLIRILSPTKIAVIPHATTTLRV